MRNVKISACEAGFRLDKWLMRYMPKATRGFIYKMLRKKNIRCNGIRANGTETLQAGDQVTLYLSEETITLFSESAKEEQIGEKVPAHKKMVLDWNMGEHVLYEDADILIVNKPVGVISQKAKADDISMVEYITNYWEQQAIQHKNNDTFRPAICNRLDRNTSGVLVAGKSMRGLQWMNQMFRERQLTKLYVCIVDGAVTEPAHIEGFLSKDTSHNRVRIEKKIFPGAAYIATEYEPIKQCVYHQHTYTLLFVHLITGKSHQIRAHLNSIGHPVVGDGKYGTKERYHFWKKEFGVHYQLLHAYFLQFGDASYLPEQYKNKIFLAPLPEKFSQVCDLLSLPNKDLSVILKNRK